MTINFDVVVENSAYEIDMKTGLETLQGVSDASRCIAETLLTGSVPERQTKRESVRTTLKRTFKGSYGQIFSIDVNEEPLRKELKRIKKPVFVELMSYFMYESLYLEAPKLSASAQNFLEEMGDTSEALLQQLRVSSMERIHRIATSFGHGVKIRYRQSAVDQIVIGSFNQRTVEALRAKESMRPVDLLASITRFNINTGNGRLLLLGEEETVAFGFSGSYKQVSLPVKKMFSENLDYNNGLDRENWKILRLRARPVRLKDQTIVKYNVFGFEQDE